MVLSFLVCSTPEEAERLDPLSPPICFVAVAWYLAADRIEDAILFIDIVGYSKLLINEQSEQIQKLKEIVRGTEQFRLAEAPVLCALEIAKDLKAHPELQVRMGVHSGPVNEVTDLNA